MNNGVMSTVDAMWAAVAANPDDDTAKLALADWYDENDGPGMAHALRWCVDRGKWPLVSPVMGSATWLDAMDAMDGRRNPANKRHQLPSAIYSRFHRGKLGYRSVRLAIQAVSVSLAKLRAIYELQK